LPGSGEPFFQKTIRKCSAAFDAPVFDPHVTLGRVPEDKAYLVSQFLSQLESNFRSFPLKTKELQCRKEPYQKLVITLQPEKNYRALCDVLDQFFGGRYSKPEDPHISLLYSQLSCEDIKKQTDFKDGRIPEKADIQGIALVKLYGRPGEWEITKQINFKGQ